MAIIDLLGANKPMREEEIDIVNKVNELIDSINEGGGTINTLEPNEDTTAAQASDNNAIAVGGNSNARGDNSVAVGWGALAATTNTTVVGNIAGATGYNGTAIGKGANADGVNSVAVGQGSYANELNTFSVGTSSSKRRIVNVAEPVNDTDAATKGYVEILNRLHTQTLELTVAANSTSQITVSRVDALSGQPRVWLGVAATDGTNWYGNVTAGYRVVDGSTLYVYVNNPNSASVNVNVSVMILEIEE